MICKICNLLHLTKPLVGKKLKKWTFKDSLKNIKDISYLVILFTKLVIFFDIFHGILENPKNHVPHT